PGVADPPAPLQRRMNMTNLTNFRVAVLATDGVEESELTEPVKALEEAGAQVTILSLKPGQIQGVRHDLDKTVELRVDRTIEDVNWVTSRQPDDLPAFNRAMLRLFARNFVASHP